MPVLRCHQDVQMADGRGLLLRYVAGYVPKFSSAWNAAWLNDEASTFAIVRRILRDYHPLEQEQWMQLAGRSSPQVQSSAQVRKIVAVTPADEPPAWLMSYRCCDWRSETMT